MQGLHAEVGPGRGGEVEFAVSALVEQIIAQALFSAGADEEIGVGLSGGVQMVGQALFGDVLGAQALGDVAEHFFGREAQDGSHILREHEQDVVQRGLRGTALAEGIGEKLSALPPMVKCPVLIAKPQIGVSTKFVYENLKLDADTVHPDIDGLIGAIRAKNLEQIAGHMGNVLETVTIPNYPVIAEIKEHMMEHGAAHAMMSGSGPTVFGLFANGDTAVAAYEAMRESNLAKQVYLTSIYNNAR